LAELSTLTALCDFDNCSIHYLGLPQSLSFIQHNDMLCFPEIIFLFHFGGFKGL